MAVLIIQAHEDGTVAIAAPDQIPPELMPDAEQLAQVDEAAQIVKVVLGADQTGADGAGNEEAAVSEESGTVAPAAPANEEAAMEQGFRNVRGAR